MICADEIQFALTMLDNMPGYYRDNPPLRAAALKTQLLKQLMSTSDYVHDKDEIKERSEEIHGCALEDQWKLPHFYPRGEIIVNLVKEINKQNKIANIHEFGPANYWLPAGLMKLGLKFKYQGISINQSHNPFSRVDNNHDGELVDIFCCFEVIEHLFNPEDIYHAFCKASLGLHPDHILIGCPKYTLLGGRPDWQTRDLAHVRTYTPTELHDFCIKYWPLHNYAYKIHSSHMMVVHGEKKNA